MTHYTSSFFALFALSIVATRPIVGKLFDRVGPNIVVYPGFAMFIKFSPNDRAGVATATYFLALDIGVGIGSFLLSVVVAHIGYQGMYLGAAAVVALTAVFYYVLRRQKTVLAE